MAGMRKTAVVIGNGLVGHRFCEKLVEFDAEREYRLVTFCEEPRPAYDRVHLTSYFGHRDPGKLAVARLEWYRDNGIEIHVGDRAAEIDRARKLVVSQKGWSVPYDRVVLATGSSPFVPPIPGTDKRGVFVYRTIEDLDAIIEYANKARTCAVIGGGLLGLEAAKAAYDLGLETHVVEFAPRLMPRQIDDQGSRLLVRKIQELGVSVHLRKSTQQFLGNGKVEGMEFVDGGSLQVDMVIVSAGIRPRDELARDCGLEIGQRGGIAVDDHLQTSDPDIFAIGEAASHQGMVYGLIAPGWQMAETAARHFTGEAASFTGADLSTKLKLMGVDVASFGDYEASPDDAVPLVVEDPFAGVYKKLLFSPEGHKLVGGVLVGDASDYPMLSLLAKSGEDLSATPAQLARLGGGESNGGLGKRRRSADLLLQQRHQGRDLQRDSRAGLDDHRCCQGMHCGRHRLRRLPAARDQCPQRRTRSRRQERGCQSVRALPVHSPGSVRHHQDQADQDIQGVDPRVRQRPRLRNLQARRDIDPCLAMEREHHRPRSSHVAGHQ